MSLGRSLFFNSGNALSRGCFGRSLSVLALLLLAFSEPAARADWPEFRGPWGDGHVSAPGDTNSIGLPLHWSETNNVKWKTEIPYRGWSTPVVMGGQVWLTTATEDGHDFFAICVDAETGQVRFNEKVFHSDNPEPLGNGASIERTSSPIGTVCCERQTVRQWTFWSAGCGVSCPHGVGDSVDRQVSDLPHAPSK